MSLKSKVFAFALTMPSLAMALTVEELREIQAPATATDVWQSLDDVEKKEETPSLVDDVQVDESVKPQAESKIQQEATFLLASVRVIGNETLSAENITNVVKPFVGKQVTSAQLQGIAKSITQLFVDQGFVTSRCIIPAQKVENGVVVLQIEEDKLGDIVLSGTRPYLYDQAVFEQYLYDLKGKTIQVKELNSRLQMLSRIPSSRIKPRLQKSAFGKTDLVLDIEPMEDRVSLSYNNQASKYTNTDRYNASAVWRHLAGRGDALMVSGSFSPEIRNYSAFNLSYMYPVGRHAGNLKFNLSSLDYRLDPDEIGYDEVQYEGSSSNWSLVYEQPFWLEKNGDFKWSSGLEQRDSTAATVYNTVFDANGAGYEYVSAKDQVTAAFANIRLQKADTWLGVQKPAVNTINAKFIHSLEGVMDGMAQEDIDRKIENIDANIEPIRGPIGDVTGMKASFGKLYLNYSRLQQLPKGFRALVSMNAEKASAKKIPSVYNYTEADGGVDGYGYRLAVYRNLAQGLVGGLGYKQDTSIEYVFSDANTSTRTTEYDRSPFVELMYNREGWGVNLQYYATVPEFNQNVEKFKVNVSKTW